MATFMPRRLIVLGLAAFLVSPPSAMAGAPQRAARRRRKLEMERRSSIISYQAELDRLRKHDHPTFEQKLRDHARIKEIELALQRLGEL